MFIHSSGPKAVDSVEHLKIVATVTNTGDETLKVLNDPRGPLNKLPTDTFVITDTTGAQPSFTGIKLKYVPNTAVTLDAYSTLAPGESVVVEHDRRCHPKVIFLAHIIIHMHLVGNAYNFTASGPASYDIHTRKAFYIVNPDSTISTLLADVDSHAAKISGKLAVARRTLVKRATYNGCTPSQQSLLEDAASVAQGYAAGALSYASSPPPPTSRYTTWFGAYTPARYNTVASHFSNISANDFSSYTFDCSTCTETDTYAYVYPDE